MQLPTLRIYQPACAWISLSRRQARNWVMQTLVNKPDLRPAQQEEEAGLAQGRLVRQHRTAAG